MATSDCNCRLPGLRRLAHRLLNLLLLLLLLLSLGLAQKVGAAAVKVDDSGSLVSQTRVPMRWSQARLGRRPDNTVEGSVQVALRLDLSPWLNRPVRLYMALPPSTGEPIQASWTAQGRLLPGTLRSGGRSLVFNDVVRSKRLEESIFLTLKSDARRLAPQQTLAFYFEIEIQ